MPTYNFLRSLYGLWNRSAVLITTPSGTNDADGNPQAAPVSSSNPFPVMVIGGSAGGGGSTTVNFPTITATYAPQSLTVGAGQTQLALPTGTTDARVFVISGSVRRSIGGAASVSTALLNVGDDERISGAELAAYRLTREGSADAQISVEPWKVS